MADNFFFYDLETSGVSSSKDRIMQFGGQRTDLDLNPMGDPININVRLADDILPGPEAILISGISPIENKEGISEAEFAGIFNNDIAKPSTIFVGFNNLRFDDEFMRYLNYRNFYDAYSWHWQDGSSRWDLLDVVRMTRALRPEGINWPFTEDNKPTNRLEKLTALNKLKHANAHDAMSDALATIEVAKLIKGHQPKLFDFLLNLRKKPALIEFLKNNDTIVYTSSHYSSEILHTTVVYVLNLDTDTGSALVFDLRQNAKDFIDLDVDELAKLWEYDPDSPKPRLPVKTVKLNRCPAVAPLSVLDEGSLKRLDLDMKLIETNRKLVSESRDEFAAKLKKVAKKLDDQRDERRSSAPRIPSVDEKLYDKFIPRTDAAKFKTARQRASKDTDFETSFEDKRLNEIYSLYRARNYTDHLSKEDLLNWQEHVRSTIFEGTPSKYEILKQDLELLKKTHKKDKAKLKLLSDVEVYAESILSGYGTD